MTPDERTRNPYIARYAELMEMSKYDLVLLIGRLEGRVAEMGAVLVEFADPTVVWHEASVCSAWNNSAKPCDCKFGRARAALKGTP